MTEALRDITIGEVIGIMVSVAAFVTGSWAFLRRTWPVFRGVEDFLHEWRGTPEKLGVTGQVIEPAKPGVVETIQIHDKLIAQNANALGASARAQQDLTDQIHHLDNKISKLDGDVAELRKGVQDINTNTQALPQVQRHDRKESN